MAAAVEAAEAEESITAVLFSCGLCTLAQTKEFTIINSHNLFHMFLVGALAPTVPLDDWRQVTKSCCYLESLDLFTTTATAVAAAATPLPMAAAAATIIRQVGSGAGWASRVKGSPLGSTVIPSLPLLLWAIHYYYCVARGEGPFSKLTEPWGGRNNPLLPCMSDAASAKRHLATLLSCTIDYILITAKAAI